MKVYYVRHQAGGVCTEYPFSLPPSELQVKAVERIMAARHGARHAKTKKVYWTRVVEAEMLGPNDVPQPPATGSPAGSGGAEMVDLVAAGEGQVVNPSDVGELKL